jgi:outer membrane protein assembly factor BamB
MFVVLAAIFVLADAGTPPSALDARWTTRLDAAPSTAAGFDTAAAYVPLKDGRLVAVDLETGVVRWSREVATAWPPESGDGLVFVVSDAAVQALDARTGAPRWQAALPGGAAAPLYWDTGWLIASTPAGDLIAFRASDGARIWRQALGSPLSARPGPALDRLYVGLQDGRLLSLALATGELLWARSLSGQVTGLLALPDQLVAATRARRVHSLDLVSGRERWAWGAGGDVAGSPTADDRRIYFASRDNVVRAVDRRSGNLRWLAPLPSRPSGGPVVIAEAVVVPSVSRELAGFNAATGKPALTIAAAGEIGAPPFLRQTRHTGPRLITLSLDGQLQGFGIRFEPMPAQLTELPGTPAVP